MLFCRNNFYTVLFQNVFIVSGIVTVTSKAIDFSHENDVEYFAVTVFYHSVLIRYIVEFRQIAGFVSRAILPYLNTLQKEVRGYGDLWIII